MLQDGTVRVLGTMSGTSLDGVDAAVIETDGHRIIGFGPSDYRPYTAEEQAILRAHLGRWPEDDVEAAAAVVEDAHIALLRRFEPVDLIGFHGQTLAHDPGGRGTHQCGDGARIAGVLSRPVVWDFRSADVAAGGQGAPLAPFYHFALAKWIGAQGPMVFLNLGGVGNLTWVDPQHETPEADGALIAFDTGPANAPINDLMEARRGAAFDADGALAAAGMPDMAVIDRFLQQPYFDQAPPKSVDRNAFAALAAQVATLGDADAAATLTQAVVASAARAVAMCPAPPARVLVTGGGRRNKAIMQGLAEVLDCDVSPVESVGLNGDMLEAQAFAFLAVRTLRGLPISAPGTTGVAAPMRGGVVDQPGQ